MIRQAKSTDYEAIMANEKLLVLDVSKIADTSYRITTQKNGFLLEENTTREQYEEQLKSIYLVYETSEGIVGHLRIDEELHMVYERPITWIDEELEHAYKQEPYKYLGRIAVIPTQRNKGIAHQLLQEAEKQLLEQGIHYAYLFVVISQLTNFASILFHEEHGYRRVNVSGPFSFSGMKYYQSFMYGKKLG